MSELTKKDLRSPMSASAVQKLRGFVGRIKSNQSAAADLTEHYVADYSGRWQDAYVVLDTTFGAGESMTVDILVNGTSITSTGSPISVTTANAQVKLSFNPLLPNVSIGDKITIARNWTAGSSDTTPANCVVLEWA